MKEITEIKISNYKYDFSTLKKNDFLRFKFEDKNLAKLLGGEFLENEENILRFETQGYYEGIRKCEANEGISVKIFKDWKLEDFLGEGIISKKYFVKSKKEDRNITKELTSENSVEIDFDIIFSDEERELLKYGISPIEREQKWFVFEEKNELRFIRSWTGTEFYRAKWVEIRKNKWKFEKLIIHTDNNKMDKQKEINFFKIFIENHLMWMKKIMS